jgi:hypothetical protein
VAKIVYAATAMGAGTTWKARARAGDIFDEQDKAYLGGDDADEGKGGDEYKDDDLGFLD